MQLQIKAEDKGESNMKRQIKAKTVIKQKSSPNIMTGYNFDEDSKIMKIELAILACQDRNWWRKFGFSILSYYHTL